MIVLNAYPQQCPPPAWPNLILSASGKEVAYPQRAGGMTQRSVIFASLSYCMNGHPAAGKWCIKEIIGHRTEQDRRDFVGRS